MRIAIIQDHLRSGGTERQSLLLADAFAGRGMDSSLVTFRPGGQLSPGLLRAERISLQGFDTGLDWWAPGLVRRLRALEPDIVLCMGRMANCHGLRLLRGLPRAKVLGSMRTGKALPLPYRAFLRRAPHVVANSRDAREQLIVKHEVPAERISVINNSLIFRPPTQDPEQRQRLRRELGAGPGTSVLLNVGMFRPEKNQRELIEICLRLPRSLDWQLWLIGDGPALTECVRMAGELNLSQRVRFLGWKADPSPWYAAADLAVHASTSEALSNFLIEAQGNGLPCVAYEAQGNGECMIEGKTGHIVPRGNTEAFCAALLELAGEDATVRRQRSQRAMSHARENFDETRQVDAYLQLFHKLLDDNQA